MLIFRPTKVKYLATQNNANLFLEMGSPTTPSNFIFVTTGNVSSNTIFTYAMTLGGANTWPGGSSIVLRIAANNSIIGARGNNGVVGSGGIGGIGSINGSNGSNGHAGYVGGRALNVDVTRQGANTVVVYVINEGIIAAGEGGTGGLGGGGGGGGHTKTTS